MKKVPLPVHVNIRVTWKLRGERQAEVWSALPVSMTCISHISSSVPDT